MTLAYAFWHVPAEDASGYEDGLVAFHAALAADPPRGFSRSWTWRLEAPPWFAPADVVYLDWYLVTDFTALGALNEAAVRGSRAEPHDAVARLARVGTAGLYGRLAGTGEPVPHLAFVDKPPDVPYPAAHDLLASTGASVWMRQMTLGPGPEFVLTAKAAPDILWTAHRAEAAILR